MNPNDAQIKAAIDMFDIDTARNLLREALSSKPSAETFYLASQVAINDNQRRSFLEKALELEPNHAASRQALSGAPIQATPIQATPIQAAPLQAAPLQAAPLQATPLQAAPLQATPLQAVPLQPSYQAQIQIPEPTSFWSAALMSGFVYGMLFSGMFFVAFACVLPIAISLSIGLNPAFLPEAMSDYLPKIIPISIFIFLGAGSLFGITFGMAMQGTRLSYTLNDPTGFMKMVEREASHLRSELITIQPNYFVVRPTRGLASLRTMVQTTIVMQGNLVTMVGPSGNLRKLREKGKSFIQ